MKPWKEVIKSFLPRMQKEIVEEVHNEIELEEINQGWHYCPDWDGMLICPDDPESDACTCDLVAYKAQFNE